MHFTRHRSSRTAGRVPIIVRGGPPDSGTTAATNTSTGLLAPLRRQRRYGRTEIAEAMAAQAREPPSRCLVPCPPAAIELAERLAANAPVISTASSPPWWSARLSRQRGNWPAVQAHRQTDQDQGHLLPIAYHGTRRGVPGDIGLRPRCPSSRSCLAVPGPNTKSIARPGATCVTDL